MASENAKKVARKVSENLRNGKKVILGEIIREVGYSDSVSKSPTIVTETDSYKEEISPIVNRWAKERDRLTAELEKRDLSKERYETVMKSIDIVTKNIQLLSGGATEKVTINLSNEQKEKLKSLFK